MVLVPSSSGWKRWLIFIGDHENAQGEHSSFQDDLFHTQGPIKIYILDHLVKGHKSLPLIATKII